MASTMYSSRPSRSRISFPSSLFTFATVLVSFVFILSCHVALAVDVVPDSIPKADHNHHRLSGGEYDLEVQSLDSQERWDEMNSDQNAILYEADFIGADRSLIGRALGSHTPLINNVAVPQDVKPGTPIFYQVEKSVIFGNKSAPGEGLPSIPFEQFGNTNITETDDSGDTRTVFISINTCLQPKPNRTSHVDIPQLTLYISQSTSNVMPGPTKPEAQQTPVPLLEGFAEATVQASSDLFIGVYAPNLTFASNDDWHYEIAASIDAPYHRFNNINAGPNTPILQFVDSDTSRALLVTTNLTANMNDTGLKERWIQRGNPFTLFAFPNASVVSGLQHSYCGLQQASLQFPINSTQNITTRGDVGLPKGQFYLQNLQSGTTYTAFMVMDGNSTANGSNGSPVVGGGGAVWPPNMKVQTKSNNNCELLFDLPFCSSIAYAVPSSTNFTSNTSAPFNGNLSQFYDQTAQAYYQDFDRSMQQIPCNTTDTARYSLVAGCDDCAASYKEWLCAVAIPRCEDFDADATRQILVDGGSPIINNKALMPRNVGASFSNKTAPGLGLNGTSSSNITMKLYANSSRLPLIDQVVAPGPYMEFLPCDDLCYNLVRNCPASMGFTCPQGRMLQRSYGPAKFCNLPGSVFIVSAAGKHAFSLGSMLALVLGVIGFVML
ncbi:hypothetical protein NA57DRAFT_77305 [Rhizodiscina lignyota]|uniref:Calcium influx-promoting protein ehs1 n=1 Tax=Rhizodiscina lignyota TaxID=1504668 RepID=A0A9P4IEH4_9PEZI|nr:hypothetical protein NA57DRAFT_77305 [Rhizodiscina lignyota]